jgi:hypothetical protein
MDDWLDEFQKKVAYLFMWSELTFQAALDRTSPATRCSGLDQASSHFGFYFADP